VHKPACRQAGTHKGHEETKKLQKLGNKLIEANLTATLPKLGSSKIVISREFRVESRDREC